MAKYPCGICENNVRSAGILCTGSCHKWVHFKCAELTLPDIKIMEKEDLLGQWTCSRCNLNTTEGRNILSSENSQENFEQLNGSSLAEEINKSILQENEELKQELHQEKNKTSIYVLELEDKLKDYEENIESMKNLFHEREKQLLNEIKSLEQKLKSEKEANENFIIYAEEEARGNLKEGCFQSGNCRRCVIYKEETTKMLDTIRTLESIIKTLQEKIYTISGRRQQRAFKAIQALSSPDFTSKNSFEVLQSDFEGDKSDVSDCIIIPNTVNTSNVGSQTHTWRKTHRKDSSAQKGERCHINTRRSSQTKQKLLLCADSHGRDLTFHLNKHSKSLDAVGFVRPGGLAEQILNFDNIDGEELGPNDVLAIACGSNDVFRNEAQRAIDAISETLDKYSGFRIVLVDLPTRHDLKNWSCVNKEIRKFNKNLETISQEFPNVSLVRASGADRYLHTRHGMHLNARGKYWLAKLICEALEETKEIEVSKIYGTVGIRGTVSQLPSSQEACSNNTGERAPQDMTNSNADGDTCATAFTSTSELLIDGVMEERASLENCPLSDLAAPP
ncbi:hypothetical protein J6590_102891 [Homalodisca vitripennis]|nr:hypothetical protein J6590_102891 [Homalodisca vitripennis]